MANIRFVKPPNDNRVRQYPKSGCQEDAIHISTPAPRDAIHMATPKAEQVLHITTPKRKSGQSTPWDIFVTSKSPQSTPVSSLPAKSPRKNVAHHHDKKKCIDNDPIQISESSHKCSSASRHYDNNNSPKYHNLNQDCTISLAATASKWRDKNDGLSLSIARRTNRNTDVADNSIELQSDHFDHLSDQHENTLPRVSGENERGNKSWDERHRKCPIMTNYRQFGSNADKSLCNDLCHSLPAAKKAPIGQHQQTHAETPGKCPGEEKEMRSVAQCQLGDSTSETTLSPGSDNPPSFFRSINSNSYHLKEEDASDTDDMAFNMEDVKSLADINPFRKLQSQARPAWEPEDGMSIEGSVHDLASGNSRNKRISVTSTEKLNYNGSHVTLARSDSGTSMTADRLRIRRCALADPEKMIISQELRERIEKDIEKRKASMVRKVSQFLNVQLGLNKEEDLI